MKGVIKKNQMDIGWKHINTVLKFLSSDSSRNHEEKIQKIPQKRKVLGEWLVTDNKDLLIFALSFKTI